MDESDLDRLRFLLAGLREPGPSEESERQALAAFKRWARQARTPGPQLGVASRQGVGTPRCGVPLR